jgi:hypothetical protein
MQLFDKNDKPCDWCGLSVPVDPVDAPKKKIFTHRDGEQYLEDVQDLTLCLRCIRHVINSETASQMINPNYPL